jgi:hypothetical protein
VTKIDAFAHILRPAHTERLESITSGKAVAVRPLDELGFTAAPPMSDPQAAELPRAAAGPGPASCQAAAS